MSVRLMSMVFDSDIDSTKKLIMLAVSDFANDEGRSIYPSVSTLCNKTSLSERTVRKQLKELRAKGLLAIEKKSTSKSPNTYYIGVQEMQGCRRCTPEVQEMQVRGAGDAPNPPIEPSKNHQEKEPDSTSQASKPKPLPQPPNPPVPPAHDVQNCTTSQDRPEQPPPPPLAPAAESSPPPATAMPAYAVAHWNALAEFCGLAKIRGVAGARLKHLRARIAADPEFWDTVLQMCNQLEPWAKGRGERKWTIDFDWIIASETNYCKLAEGKFGKPQTKVETQGAPAATERF